MQLRHVHVCSQDQCGHRDSGPQHFCMTDSCHWGELHRVYWWVGQVHSCYILVSHALYQVLPFPNKGKLTLCLDNVLGKTYFQLIAPTVTPQASTLESPKAVQNEVVFAQLCQGSCTSAKK